MVRCPDISVITVGYFSQKTLPRLLASLQLQRSCDFEFIYVENSLSASSIPIVQKYFPDATFLKPKKNIGFGKACNLAARKAQGRFLLFLNPDCEIKTFDTVYNLLKMLLARPDMGICIPQFLDVHDNLKSGAHRFYFGEKYFPNKFIGLPGNIAWGSGAAFLIPATVFNVVGGFDERYYMHAEDMDIGLKVRCAGYFIAEVKGSLILHIGGASSPYAYRTQEEASNVVLKALTCFTRKHYSELEHQVIWKKYRKKALLGMVKSIILLQRRRILSYCIRFKFACKFILQQQ